MKKLLAVGYALLITISLSAQKKTIPIERAFQELDRRGEVYFSFQLKDHSLLSQLTHVISLDNIKENTIYAYANRKELSEFLTYQIDFTVLTAPSELEEVQMTDRPEQVLDWNYYPTYPAYETLMAEFVSNHPDICKLLTIGTLASGRKLLAVKITDNPGIQENEPEFLYSSSIHGDETTGYILMLHLIDYLLTGYGTDARITEMVNNTEIVICPLANPDGTYKGGNNTVNGATRGNANDVDINRNFPDPKGGPHPDGNVWQPETNAFMSFAGFHHFTMGANFHGGTEVINYPWDTWSKLAADDAWWIFVSREYADTVHLHAPANYMNEYQNGITNGNAWYEIEGGRQDYMNYFRNCREVTMEISDIKLLPTSQLINHWDYNYRSLLNYIQESGYGLQGLVTDSMSGEPLNAKVFITGFDKDSSHVFTDPAVGDYHRLLKGGFYNVTFSSAGYYPKTFSVQVTDKQPKICNVQLYNGRLKTNFKADTTIIAVDQSVHFTDQSAGSPQTWSWTFEGGNPSSSTETNPIVNYDQPGFYTVKLVVTRPGSVDSLERNQYIEVKPWYLMGEKSYTVCHGQFFDSGGPNSQYTDNENYTITFSPPEPAKKLKATFNNLAIEEGGTNCENDRLLVYDGISTNDNLIATLCGSSIPEPLFAQNVNGALTFRFISNSSNIAAGWNITLACDSNVGIVERFENQVRIFPNPAVNGIIIIETESAMQKLIVRDITGKIVSSFSPFAETYMLTCNWPTGIYLVQIGMKGQWINRKIQVINP